MDCRDDLRPDVELVCCLALDLLLRFPSAQPVEISLPFDGQQVLFLVVAFLAGRHAVTPGAASASDQGHDMVEGQFLWRDLAAAVVAAAGGDAIFPPLALAQFTGLFPLAAQLLFGYFGKVIQVDNSYKTELPKFVSHARSLCSFKTQRRKEKHEKTSSFTWRLCGLSDCKERA